MTETQTIETNVPPPVVTETKELTPEDVEAKVLADFAAKAKESEQRAKESADTTEEKPAETKEEPEDPKLGVRFAELSRREREFTRKQREWSEKEKAIKEFEEAKKLLEEDPVEFYKRQTNKDFDYLTRQHLAKLDGKKLEEEPETKFKRLEDKLAAMEKAEAEREAKAKEQQAQAMWSAHLNEVNKFIAANKDDYEVIISYPDKALELYQDLSDQANQELGRPLNSAEVVKVINRVEELLTQDIQSVLETGKKIKKFTKAEEAKTDTKVIEKPVSQDNRPKTLTNQMSSVTNHKSGTELTEEEQLEIIRRKYG